MINAHGVEYNGKEMMRERYRVSQLTMADLVDEDFFRELIIKEIGQPWRNISDMEKPLNNQFRKRRRSLKIK